MSSKGLLLLTAALLAAAPSLLGQNTVRPKAGWGRQVTLKVPANVEVVPDIVYATYGGRQLKLDLYLPKPRPAKPVPGIIGIRGGGWQRGTRKGSHPLRRNWRLTGLRRRPSSTG